MDQNNSSGVAPVQNPNPNPAPANQPNSSGKNIGMAIVAMIIFFIPLLTGDSKKDPYVKFYTKQGFALFIVSVAASILSAVMPYYYWWAPSAIINLAIFVLFIIGIVNAASGKTKELPVIGKLGDILKL